MKNTTKNMTEGNIAKLIIGFAVPMLFGLLFQQLYNMVDTMIVGKWLGVKALAAVGSVGSVNFMIIGFCTGVCSGFAIPVAQQFGAGDMTALRKFVANSVHISAVFAAVMTTAVCLLCRNILVLMKTPEDIIDSAYTYIFIIFAGIPVTYLYNLLSGVIRSLGDSRSPVVFLLISSVLNVILDIILVKPLGVAGPAVATVASQAVSGLLCLLHIAKSYPVLRISKEEWKPDKKYILKLFAMGLPMGLQYSITAIGSVILQSSVNSLGSPVVASVTAGSKVNMFFTCPFEALGGTMATFAGQNVGARRPDRIKKGIGCAVLMGGVYAVLAFIIIHFFGNSIALLFLDAGETEILTRVSEFLFINTLFYFPLALLMVFRYTVQGMGYSLIAVFAGVIEMIARIVIAFGLVPRFGFDAVCLANPVSWASAALFLIGAFFVCLKKIKSRQKLM